MKSAANWQHYSLQGSLCSSNIELLDRSNVPAIPQFEGKCKNPCNLGKGSNFCFASQQDDLVKSVELAVQEAMKDAMGQVFSKIEVIGETIKKLGARLTFSRVSILLSIQGVLGLYCEHVLSRPFT